MRPLSIGLFIVPIIWSLIGFGAALKLGVYEDTGLLVAGVISSALVVHARFGERKEVVLTPR